MPCDVLQRTTMGIKTVNGFFVMKKHQNSSGIHANANKKREGTFGMGNNNLLNRDQNVLSTTVTRVFIRGGSPTPSFITLFTPSTTTFHEYPRGIG
jgi:hypothetical protein